MGRWSILVAREFLSWFAAAPGVTWLDVGCGTGALSRSILERARPKDVFCVDSAMGFISHARRSIPDPAVHFSAGLAQSLPLESKSIDAVVSGLVLNFVPGPEAVLAEMMRVAKPGGGIGIFVWDYADGMQMLRYFWDAAVELDPNARELDEGPRFPLCQKGELERFARRAGLKQVEATAIETETVFKDFDDYWQPFLGGVGPGAAYVVGLSEAAGRKLRDRLRDMLPAGGNGSIKLSSRAWGVKGTT